MLAIVEVALHSREGQLGGVGRLGRNAQLLGVKVRFAGAPQQAPLLRAQQLQDARPPQWVVLELCRPCTVMPLPPCVAQDVTLCKQPLQPVGSSQSGAGPSCSGQAGAAVNRGLP